MAFYILTNVARALRCGRSSINSARLTSSAIHSNQLLNNIQISKYPNVDIPNVTIHEHLLNAIVPHGSKVAMECSETGRKYTYDEIVKKSRNLSKALRKTCRLQRGDVIAILLPNIPEFPIAFLAALSGGFVTTMLNPIYTAEEISRQVKDSNSKLIITLSELHAVAKCAVGETIPIINILNKPNAAIGQGAISFNELLDNTIDLPEVVDINMNDVAIMPYSSGTTGLPKGVCLSHRNILTNMKQVGSDDFNVYKYGYEGSQQIVPAVLPFFHIFGFTIILCSGLEEGAKLLTLSHFKPDLFTNVLLDRKPTILFVVPPMITFLNMHPMITKKHLESTKIIMSGGAPLGPMSVAQLKEKVESDVIIMQGYGLTESSPAILIRPLTEPNLPATCTGRLVPNMSAKILPENDPNGEPLGPNQSGEAYVKGGNVMMRYHNRPKETADTLIDGWLRTGDMMHYDENGNFFITGRLKELIKVKGFQVSPAELEEILRDYPDVADAAVIGIPHDFSGEVPRAYIVPKENRTIDSTKVIEHVNSKVAKYKRLEGGVEIVASIPKTQSGKILRRELKAHYLSTN